jgi:predicted SPOUT superfamily RNA methylase MTH1
MIGQIARAATIYHVDEIIVFDDKLAKDTKPNRGFHRNRERDRNRPERADRPEREQTADTTPTEKDNDDDNPPRTYERSSSSGSDPHNLMARLLQYCECPQYLRRQFFPMHPDLQFAGLLAPIDAPHHVRGEDRCKYREGVVWEKLGRNGSLVNCGIKGRPVE